MDNSQSVLENMPTTTPIDQPKTKNKKFSILTIVYATLVLVLGFFTLKYTQLKKQMFQPPPNPTASISPTNSSQEIKSFIFASKHNDLDDRLIYCNYTYGFSIRIPNSWHAFLSDPMTIQNGYSCYGCGGGGGPWISIGYIDNSKLIPFEEIILNIFKSDKWTENNTLVEHKESSDPRVGIYEKYTTENNLDVYIDRQAPTAGSGLQYAYVNSPDNKFVLSLGCFECDNQTMNQVLSSLKFDNSKLNLIGIWQASGSMAAGWNDRYHFYQNGNYHFYPNQMVKSNLTEKQGKWELDTYFTPLGSQLILDGERFNLFSFGTKTDDFYPSISISGKQYWKFSDDPTRYGEEKFPSE